MMKTKTAIQKTKVTEHLEEAISKIINGGMPLGSAVGRVFDFMGIAEEEIERAKLAHPKHAKSIHASFDLLMPGKLISTSEDLYRSHCRELLARVVKGGDVKPGTNAECCHAFMTMSLKSPLRGGAATAYRTALLTALPRLANRLEWDAQEDYAGETEEILRDLRCRIGACLNRTRKKAA